MVDDSDYEELAKFKWAAQKTVEGNYYAFRNEWDHASKTQRRLMLHHAIIGRPKSPFVCDHINRNSLDNRRCNLRVCTYSENAANALRINKSGFRGVFYRAERDKWRTCIRSAGRSIYIGLYETAEEAAKAYDSAARKFYGEYAITNFTNEKAA